MQNLKKCGLILARGGSKGIPRKNLQILNGKTLLQHVVEVAIDSNLEHVYVSTEDDEIKRHCLSLGVHVHNRPQELSGDLTTDYECIYECLSNTKDKFDYVVHLRATFPKITAKIINSATAHFEKYYDNFDSMRSVIKSKQSPFKMWFLDEKHELLPVIKNNTLHSSPRQILPVAYSQNACIDLVKTETVLRKESIIGERCLAYVMDDTYDTDIDTINDLMRLELK